MQCKRRLTGATLFSGIGAPELAAPKIDWRWNAEIDPFACAVLAARFPKTPNLGDVNKIDPTDLDPVDLVVFGSPCQSFSVAGKRQGMGDPRGNLALVAFGIIGRIRPRWVVFENVPGLLSSDRGCDFAAILGALAKFGYGFAYRILDAQHFGVPQRRRRVFVVGCLGDWRPPAAVLFERDSLRRDPPPRREPAERIAPTLEVGTRNSDSADRASCGLGIAFGGKRQSGPLEVATAVNAKGGSGRMDFESETFVVPLRRNGASTSHSAGIGKAGDPALSLDCGGSLAVAFESSFARNGRGRPSAVVPPLKAQSGATGKGDAAPLVVFRLRNWVGPRPRRLTPRECERLQGLPDDFTLIDYRGKPAADGPRYRAIGNSMAVPVIRWILDRVRSQ